MLRYHILEPNPPKAAVMAERKGAPMATKALTPYQRHVKAFAKAHPGDKKLMKHASQAWKGTAHPAAKKAHKAAGKAHRAVKRLVGYDSRKVKLVKVHHGAHAGKRRAYPIGRGLFRLPRNPGAWYDRVKAGLSLDAVGTASGVAVGVVGAVGLPMLLGQYNEGKKSIAFSAGATILMGGLAAFLMPSAVFPTVAGGILVVGGKTLLYFSRKAYGWFVNPITAAAAAPGPVSSGTAAGYRKELGGYRKELAGYRTQPKQLAGMESGFYQGAAVNPGLSIIPVK